MRIGIIGAGNMASALAGGLLKSGIVSGETLSISDKNAKSLDVWRECGAFVSENNIDVISRSDVIIFAVKPNILPFVLEETKDFSKDKVFISIAAGTTISTIESILGDDAKIVRVMPNTPAKVGCGMTVISPNKNIEEKELKMAEEILFLLNQQTCRNTMKVILNMLVGIGRRTKQENRSGCCHTII